MKTVKDTFLYAITDEIVIDLGKIDAQTWKKIKADVKIIMKNNQTDEIGMAYIAAFICYISELSELAQPFDPDADLSH